MGRFGYGWHGGHEGHCGCGCHAGPAWNDRGYGSYSTPTKNEVVEEMEDYKARLEAEITALEKRINSLKEKQ